MNLTYIVKPGDSLDSIAQRFNSSETAIQQINNIANPQNLYVGQVLVVPVTDTDTINYINYTVQPGDTLGEIADRFDVDLNDLSRLNNINNPNLIYVGQPLIIPIQKPTEPVTYFPYTVQPGDTLGMIAQRFGVSIGEVMQANNIYNPNLIYAGQTILIPSYRSSPGNYITYQVQPGDTLADIADRFDVDMSDLIGLNRITNPHAIYAGQTLLIPTELPG